CVIMDRVLLTEIEQKRCVAVWFLTSCNPGWQQGVSQCMCVCVCVCVCMCVCVCVSVVLVEACFITPVVILAHSGGCTWLSALHTRTNTHTHAQTHTHKHTHTHTHTHTNTQ